MSMEVRIGTSGWVYQHWRGIFYPEELRPSDWFSFYARTFDSVEINNSFYRLPEATTFAAWREQAPPGFLYTVKASRYLTHQKKLKDPEEPLWRFFERASQLGETLGPVLYQLPPRWQLNLPRFEHFLASLPPGHTHVVELRDQSWVAEPTFQLMERYGVAHCIHDMAPLQIPVRVTARAAYLRLHGPARYSGSYPAAELERWARAIEGWRAQGLAVYVYFNNDIGGHALANALTLRALVAPRSLERGARSEG
jgi:uncharacterized protein YecE (DUF72 family)